MALTKQQIRQFKSAAQKLEPVAFLGKQGITPAFLQSVDQALASRELIKVRFAHFQEERSTLSAEIASKTGSDVVTIVGHVAVLYRAKPHENSGKLTDQHGDCDEHAGK